MVPELSFPLDKKLMIAQPLKSIRVGGAYDFLGHFSQPLVIRH